MLAEAKKKLPPKKRMAKKTLKEECVGVWNSNINRQGANSNWVKGIEGGMVMQLSQ